MFMGIDARFDRQRNSSSHVISIDKMRGGDVTTLLWDYQITWKKHTSQMSFRLVYGKGVVIPMEYIVPKLRIVSFTSISDTGVVKERFP